MNTCIAFLRGINVGGRNRLPMAELVAILEDLGLGEVRTHLQSGNAVFRTPRHDTRELAATIASALAARCGFAPPVLVLSLDALQEAVVANPFPEGESEPKSLHLFFLDSAPTDPDLARLADLRAATESCELIGKVFYLHAPDGVGRSRLAAGAEKALGGTATARNWSTVTAVLTLAKSLP